MRQNWLKTVIILSLIAVLFVNPITRSIILFILPLGSGIDDLIVFVLIIAICLILLGKLIIKEK